MQDSADRPQNEMPHSLAASAAASTVITEDIETQLPPPLRRHDLDVPDDIAELVRAG